MDFKIGDKVKCSALSGKNRWRGVVVKVGVGQVMVQDLSDKKGKKKYWVYTDGLAHV